jgi:hypothetical protein
LDTVLLIFSAGCSFLIAYMGFRITIKPPANDIVVKRYRISFITIGVLSVVSAAWLGIRSSDSSTRIESGVSEIRSEQVIRAARIVVSGFELVPTTPSDPSSALTYRLYIMNRGQIPGYAPEATTRTATTDSPMSESSINEAMNKLREAAFKIPPSRASQVEVNQQSWVPLQIAPLSASDWTQVKAGTKYLYFFNILTFTDERTPEGRFWVSEYCGTQNKDVSTIQICGATTYLK